MKLHELELKMLAELLTGGIKDEVFQADPARQIIRQSLMQKGYAEFAKEFGWAEKPERNFLLITAAGRAAYSAWANRHTDVDDAKEDSQAQADPGPLFRMVTHLKEAGMVAFRFGHNSARAQHSSAANVVKDQIRPTIERALGKTVDTNTVDTFTAYLTSQIEKGIEAGSK